MEHTHIRPDFNLIAASMHGNCVFSDAQYPVKIQHLSGQAVVGGALGSEGKIHFPLGLMVDLGTAAAGVKEVGCWLQVDCGQVQSANRFGTPTEITAAEVYVGCGQVWHKEFGVTKKGGHDGGKTTSFKEMINAFGPLQADGGLKSLEVTLTLKFGQDEMRFCSVGVFQTGMQQHKFPPVPIQGADE